MTLKNFELSFEDLRPSTLQAAHQLRSTSRFEGVFGGLKGNDSVGWISSCPNLVALTTGANPTTGIKALRDERRALSTLRLLGSLKYVSLCTLFISFYFILYPHAEAWPLWHRGVRSACSFVHTINKACFHVFPLSLSYLNYRVSILLASAHWELY